MIKIKVELTAEQHEYLTMLVESRGLVYVNLLKGSKAKIGPHLARELKMVDSLQTILDKAIK